jgi:hypothetical protein
VGGQAASDVQLLGQAADEPEQAKGAQAGSPELPDDTRVHFPALPATLQTSQGPAQAVSQQTPSTQCPDWHSAPATQAVPGIPFGTQPPDSQKESDAQAACVEQPLGQRADAPVHVYGAQAGLPTEPGERRVHLPSDAGRLQTSQGSAQDRSQHTPSTQKPLAHCDAVVQVFPSSWRGWQFPPRQTKPSAH